MSSLFPRNPERDADGNAVLYPGARDYKGVAGVFSSPDRSLEYVILAPSIEVLEKLVTDYGFTEELHRESCAIVSIKSLPRPESGVEA